MAKKEYIEREAAYPIAKKIVDAITNVEYHAGVFAYDIMDWIDDIPAADVRHVVHGRWIPMTYISELTENGWPNCRWEKAIEPDSVDGLMCSECGEIFDVADARNFCTQCGADMRGAKNV